MPEVVRNWFQSWKKLNKDWDLTFLHADNLKVYFDEKKILNGTLSNYPKQMASDVIRINLLKEYGGVWVDATCYCNRPLNDWIFDYTPSGFFCFSNPGPDRMISSWFMAANPNNKLVEIYAAKVNNFWRRNKNLKLNSRVESQIHKMGLGITFVKVPELWFTFPFRKWLKVYPYFWFHYMFRVLFLTNTGFRKQWRSSPKIKADGAHSLQKYGLNKPISPQLKEEILDRRVPVYKLDWRISLTENDNSNTVYGFLTSNQAEKI